MENYTATQLAYENGREKGRQEAQAEITALKAELEGERHRHDRYVDFELAQAKELEQVRRDFKQATEEKERLEKMVPRYSEIDRIAVMIQCSVGGCSRHWAETIAKYLVANGVCLQSGGEK